MNESQPTTPESGPATSSPLQKFRPAGLNEMEETFTDWLNNPDIRAEIQTIMALLGCEAWQAVLVRQASRATTYLSDLVDDAEDTWPGKDE